MYEVNDTIIAVSSPAPYGRVIIRISGVGTTAKINKFFEPAISEQQRGTIHGKISPTDDLQIDAIIYLFSIGHSYTNERLAEIHLYTNSSVTEALLERFLSSGVRLAQPGEFTARAYLNGRMDLSQAEAVNKIITGGNRFQLTAAQKLLEGRLTRTVSQASQQILNYLSLIEAGLDFSQEDIEFINPDAACKRLGEIKQSLEELLDGSVSYESVLDLPTVGIAGAPGVGKSSLLNSLLGRDRSIVSSQPKTTRDVLSGVLELDHCRCVIFDCAGLLAKPDSRIDELAQMAALNALENAELTIFCVDAAKEDFNRALAVWNILRCHCERSEAISIVFVATKTDLLSARDANERLLKLKSLFGCDFLPISVHTGFNLDKLKEKVVKSLIEMRDTGRTTQDILGLTARHKQAVTGAVENLNSAIDEIKNNNNEIAAMMLRAAVQGISNIGHEHIDEKILDKIFADFCIGK